MVREYRLTVYLAGYWHAGTGRGDGAGADAIVMRDGRGLPSLPGSHLRGLMRHAVRFYQDLQHWRGKDVLADTLFGLGTQGASPQPAETRFETTESLLHVGNASLPEEMALALEHPSRQALKEELFTTIQSTRLVDGVVAPRTLRSVEVCVPLTLEASLYAMHRDLTVDEYGALKSALGLIRRVGKHRTRGLGRARLELEPAA